MRCQDLDSQASCEPWMLLFFGQRDCAECKLLHMLRECIPNSPRIFIPWFLLRLAHSTFWETLGTVRGVSSAVFSRDGKYGEDASAFLGEPLP